MVVVVGLCSSVPSAHIINKILLVFHLLLLQSVLVSTCIIRKAEISSCCCCMFGSIIRLLVAEQSLTNFCLGGSPSMKWLVLLLSFSFFLPFFSLFVVSKRDFGKSVSQYFTDLFLF